jgi:proteasome lid subunit RPN8/RPN11|tara:strand:+ start:9018 stop:9467 length:450 start_codon:yes stop_codon:yes gene_type:complete
MKIIIPRSIISKLIEHALLEDPNECCGLLIGKENKVTNIQNCQNIHPSPITRYTIEPKDLMKAENFSDKNNMEILAIYHSHTHSQAYPSTTDIENAIESMWTNPYYILVSLVEKTRPVIRAYKISDDKNVEEVIIDHDGMAYISPTENY